MPEFHELDEKARVALILDGKDLSEEAADELENHLKDSPNDLISRTKLLGFLKLRRLQDAKFHERHLQHSIWMIDNQPEHPPFFHMLLSVHNESEEERERITEHWMKQVKAHSSNSKVLGNAGFYLHWFDFAHGQELLERAQELEPQNSYWPHLLGQFCFGEMIDPKRSVETKPHFARKVLEYAKRLSELDGGPVPSLVSHMWLPPCLEILGDTAGDTAFIQKLEAHDPSPPNKYWVNSEKGLIALEENRVQTAIEFLLKKEPEFKRAWDAATRKLVRELCIRNEGETVIEFLESLGDEVPVVERRRAVWIKEIRNGTVPSFRL